MHNSGNCNKIQVIIVHIKHTDLSTTTLLNRTLIYPITLSAHIYIFIFQAVKHTSSYVLFNRFYGS